MKMRIYTTLLLIVISSFALGQNCFQDWAYYQPLTIHHDGMTSLSDIQVKFVLNTAELVNAGKLQNSGADLRIMDENCQPIPFFMDSLATSEANEIWVRIPSLPAQDSVSLQLYYGNATAASAANGDDTFLFFDDFSADSVDFTKWEPIGGYAKLRVNAGILEYASNGEHPNGSRYKFVRTAMSFDEDVYFDYNARISNSNSVGFSSADSLIQRIMFRQGAFGFDTLAQIALLLDTTNNGSQVEGMYPFIRYPRHEYKSASILAGIEDTMLTVRHFANLTDSSSTDSVYQLTQIKMSGFHFMITSFLENQTIYLDYLRVRKPGAEEVTATSGPEEVLIANSKHDLWTSIPIRLHPNPTREKVNIEGLPTGTFDIRLLNVQGQKIYQEKIFSVENQVHSLRLQSLPQGMYWLTISEEGRIRSSQPLVIQE